MKPEIDKILTLFERENTDELQKFLSSLTRDRVTYIKIVSFSQVHLL